MQIVSLPVYNINQYEAQVYLSIRTSSAAPVWASFGRCSSLTMVSIRVTFVRDNTVAQHKYIVNNIALCGWNIVLQVRDSLEDQTRDVSPEIDAKYRLEYVSVVSAIISTEYY